MRHSTTATLDRFGFPLVQTDPLGDVTELERDPEGRVTEMIQPSVLAVQQGDVITSFTYTAAPSGSGDPPAGLL